MVVLLIKGHRMGHVQIVPTDSAPPPYGYTTKATSQLLYVPLGCVLDVEHSMEHGRRFLEHCSSDL